MIKYVAGFMFSPHLDRLVLIEKQKPDWQKGRLNGIGGKINGIESEKDAMIREFEEETGVHCIGWNKLCSIGTDDYSVAFFYAVGDAYMDVKTTEEEKVVTINTTELHNYPVIDNLAWLIPLAIDKIEKYSGKITF